MRPDRTCFLFDNGSFRAESTLALRRVAADLQARLAQVAVVPVSLLHSTRVEASELGGTPAQLLEPALDAWAAEHPDGAAVLLPFFFGPSGALVDYVPERLAALAKRHPRVRFQLAAPLVIAEEPPEELVAILADQVRHTARARAWSRPAAVLCDHGSPLAAVTAVRDRLGLALAAALGEEVRACGVAAMERREGDAYAFNEPLLARRLATPPFAAGEVVVALQFLSPGRHAGPGGDVAEICTAAETEARAEGRTLNTAMTEPLACDPRLLPVLERRFHTAWAKLA
jgi:hypothetical protein